MSQITKIEEEIMSYETRLSTVTNKFLDGEIDASTYNELKHRVELEKKVCTSKLELLNPPQGC